MSDRRYDASHPGRLRCVDGDRLANTLYQGAVPVRNWAEQLQGDVRRHWSAPDVAHLDGKRNRYADASNDSISWPAEVLKRRYHNDAVTEDTNGGACRDRAGARSASLGKASFIDRDHCLPERLPCGHRDNGVLAGFDIVVSRNRVGRATGRATNECGVGFHIAIHLDACDVKADSVAHLEDHRRDVATGEAQDKRLRTRGRGAGGSRPEQPPGQHDATSRSHVPAPFGLTNRASAAGRPTHRAHNS